MNDTVIQFQLTFKTVIWLLPKSALYVSSGRREFARILQQDLTETKNPTSPSQPQPLSVLSTQPKAWEKSSMISA